MPLLRGVGKPSLSHRSEVSASANWCPEPGIGSAIGATMSLVRALPRRERAVPLLVRRGSHPQMSFQRKQLERSCRQLLGTEPSVLKVAGRVNANAELVRFARS